MEATLGAGAVFAGYRIERLLGEGGMGKVYLARDRDLPRQVALKLLNWAASSDPDGRRRFLHEAETVAGLEHPNVVTIYARGEEQNRPWISMTYIDGSDVDAELRNGPIDPPRAVWIVTEIADALDYAHQRGVLHRDVKPANILVTNTARERVMLTDFGIAKVLDNTTALTRTGELLMSFHYAAPERIDSIGAVDHRADVYSLGCTLYHMLTGTLPYPGKSISQLIHGHLNAPIPRPSHINSALSPAFDEVIARALAKDPADRYGSCAHLAAAATQASGRTNPHTTITIGSNCALPPQPEPGAAAQTGDPTSEAEDWYRKAAAGGDASAMHNLGLLLEKRGDLAGAEDWYRKAIVAGNKDAMRNLGLLLYDRGDLARAEDWYRKAIAAGNKDSMRNLGILLRDRGDLAGAEDWYRKAIAVGDAGAMHNLGILLRQRGDLAGAEDWYRKAIAAGNKDAMRNLGILLRDRGDLAGAQDWYRKAIAVGDAGAMTNLGFLLEKQGDLAGAEDWYRRAAAGGDAYSMNNLGILLKKRGDLTEAEDWYRKAIAAGDKDSMRNLGLLLYDRGDLAGAEDWYRKAAAGGDARAMADLGLLLQWIRPMP
ncbi:tetratricopeptide repeat protein [Nocardia sp. NPDC101769]|uniref:tetratricopeptide repeat protein n=1 Tax=Nocardia sp. NPDC101769 TaxID=3364333 RepID=UPI00380AA895